MARKTNSVTITAEGRDKGKIFVLTEMPAIKADKWATRALLAIGRSGASVPEEAVAEGMLALATVGINKLLQAEFEDVEPLLDEMLTCVQIQPDPKKQDLVRSVMWDDEIEEVATLLRLREEVLHLHMGFSIRGALSTLGASATRLQDSENTSISPEPLAP